MQRGGAELAVPWKSGGDGESSGGWPAPGGRQPAVGGLRRSQQRVAAAMPPRSAALPRHEQSAEGSAEGQAAPRRQGQLFSFREQTPVLPPHLRFLSERGTNFHTSGKRQKLESNVKLT